MQGENLPRGLVFAFFTLGERGVWPDSYLKEEIDNEFLSKHITTNAFWSNIWDDWSGIRGGPNQAAKVTANFNYSGWNTYKIRWLNNEVQWLISGVVVRTSTSVLPDDPMRFLLWAPDSSWGDAYDAGLAPATTAAANKSYYMDVDYVHVTSVAPPPGAFINLGDGLARDLLRQASVSPAKRSRASISTSSSTGAPTRPTSAWAKSIPSARAGRA